jgi:hypothetical protein
MGELKKLALCSLSRNLRKTFFFLEISPSSKKMVFGCGNEIVTRKKSLQVETFRRKSFHRPTRHFGRSVRDIWSTSETFSRPARHFGRSVRDIWSTSETFWSICTRHLVDQRDILVDQRDIWSKDVSSTNETFSRSVLDI